MLVGNLFASLSGIDQSRARRAEAVGALRTRCFGRRVLRPEFCRVLVPPSVRRRTGAARPDFLRANVLAGVSRACRVTPGGTVRAGPTMVWTHLPSNVLLILIPLMPTLSLAVTLLLVRFSISQMDVPARQSYVDGCRPAGTGGGRRYHGIARTLGAAISRCLLASCLPTRR